jgi:hypothetical protein
MSRELSEEVKLCAKWQVTLKGDVMLESLLGEESVDVFL